MKSLSKTDNDYEISWKTVGIATLLLLLIALTIVVALTPAAAWFFDWLDNPKNQLKIGLFLLVIWAVLVGFWFIGYLKRRY